MKASAEPLFICTHAQTAETIWAPMTIGAHDRARCTELGAAFAGGLALGVF